jgi:hypothetical protein
MQTAVSIEVTSSNDVQKYQIYETEIWKKKEW